MSKEQLPYKETDLMDHDADGIRELDNNLPRWWVWLFYLSIAYSVVYMLHFHVLKAGDPTIVQYEKAIKTAETAAAAKEKENGGPAQTPTTAATDETTLIAGKSIFDINCQACHTATGAGLVGPNLCDEYFTHGASYADSIHIILEGVPAKGMIAWKAVLNPEQIHSVASYIWSLRGTNPANPKAPEGDHTPPPYK